MWRNLSEQTRQTIIAVVIIGLVTALIVLAYNDDWLSTLKPW